MPSEGMIILGALAAFFFCMMFVSYGLSYYFGKKAAEDEANSQVSSTWGPSASSPGPAAASDVLSEREKLLQGTSSKAGAKTIQLDEVDINVASPPSIPNPFTINTGDPSKTIEYTITFDIKVEKNLGGENEEWIIMDRGGSGDDANGRRPKISLLTKWNHGRECTTAGAIMGSCVTRDVVNSKDYNTLQVSHKPSLTVNTSVGPQAGQDFKNCTIVVNSTDENKSNAKIYWDSVAVGDATESLGTDWGNLASSWRWAGGQTAVNASIGSVKVKNAYIFGRALDDDEIATLLGRGSSATSTYCTEPKLASWKFNPSGYESD
jgi:hypothetical protein